MSRKKGLDFMKRLHLYSARMRTRWLAGLVGLAVAGAAHAGVFYQVTWDSGFANGGVIPDGNLSGWSDTRTITYSEIPDPRIVDVNVRLNLSGGFNGDLYGYLVHGSGFAVLLNRVGKTASNPFGYSDPGFGPTGGGAAFTLDDQAVTYNKDIHFYREATPAPTYNASGQLTGTWAPDGRNVNPLTVNGTESRTALLSSFNSLDPNGSWTLFLADLSFGEQSTLVSWGLDFTLVPEPVNVALGIFGVGLVAAHLVRRLVARKARPAH